MVSAAMTWLWARRQSRQGCLPGMPSDMWLWPWSGQADNIEKKTSKKVNKPVIADLAINDFRSSCSKAATKQTRHGFASFIFSLNFDGQPPGSPFGNVLFAA